MVIRVYARCAMEIGQQGEILDDRRKNPDHGSDSWLFRITPQEAEYLLKLVEQTHAYSQETHARRRLDHPQEHRWDYETATCVVPFPSSPPVFQNF